MSLREFVRRDGVLDPATLKTETWEQLETMELAPLELLAAAPEELSRLPRRTMRTVLTVVERFRRWRETCDALVARRESTGQPALPAGVLDATVTLVQLEAVERAAAVLRPGDHPDDDSWGSALRSALDLWERAFALARKDGFVRATLDESHKEATEFQELAGPRHALEGLPPHRWMALSRGARHGALTLSFELPRAALAEQAALLGDALGPLPEDVGLDRLTEELVLAPLLSALPRELDREAARQSIDAAATAYSELIEGAPVDADRVGAVYVGGPRQAFGLAVVDRTGLVIAVARIAPTEGWTQRVEAWLTAEDAKHVVLPTQAPARTHLAELRRVLAPGRTLHAMRPAALAEAREAFLAGEQRTFTPEAAAAAVLALRAAVPAKAWTAIDPVHLGLAEYQADLDPDELRGALALAQALSERATAAIAARSGGVRTAGGRPTVGGKWLNPLVKTLTDLRPGMMVAAVVTSITRFGAFVDIGLPQQGLIHVSDLADRFVEDPAEIVQVGQQLQARIVNVDQGRGRISLSLKAESRPREPSAGRPSRPGGSGSSSRPSSSSGSSSRTTSTRTTGLGDRAKALRDLENLFKR